VSPHRKRLALVICTFVWCCHAEAAKPSLPARKPEEQQAAIALFERGDLHTSIRLANHALSVNPADRNALFVLMEASVLCADEAQAMRAAAALVRSPGDPQDPRVAVALGRISTSAANSRAFAAIAPQLTGLVDGRHPLSSRIALALLSAEADGYRGAPSAALARSAGLLTNWRLIAGFGEHPNTAFDRTWPPENDQLSNNRYGKQFVERFRFDDGILTVPDYFDHDGIVFGSSDFNAVNSGYYVLRVESKGTLELHLNGNAVLLKDDRFHEGPDVVIERVWLNQGRNRIFLKSLPSAAPLRVSIVPGSSRAPHAMLPDLPMEERVYLGVAESFFAEHHAEATVAIARVPISRWPLPLLLLATQIDGSEPAQGRDDEALIQQLLERAPQAAAGELWLAERANHNDRFEEALLHLGRAVKLSPHSAQAQELKYDLAARFGWAAEQASALRMRLQLHPDCAAISEARRFYLNAHEFTRALTLAKQLEHCTSTPTTYWQSLNEHGQQKLALRSIERLQHAHPLDRFLRLRLIKQMVLMGLNQEAKQQAQELAVLSPNSDWFRQVAASPSLVFNGAFQGNRIHNLALIQPYRRDARMALAARGETQPRTEATTVFDDRVLVTDLSGSDDLYQHRLIQLWDKDAIDAFGEVAMPSGAQVLELRTLKLHAGSSEPVRSEHKPTISMTSITPGDAIEIEYIQHFDKHTLNLVPTELDQVFSSPNSQTEDARFIVISPQGHEPLVRTSSLFPSPQQNNQSGYTICTWHLQNILAFAQEPSMPSDVGRGTVHVATLDSSAVPDLFDAHRETLIEASKVTARVRMTAVGLRHSSANETLDAIVRFVNSSITPAADQWLHDEVTSADESLQSGEGSRAATIISLASALGLKADLVLAAELGTDVNECSNLSCYEHPLVRITTSDKKDDKSAILVDTVAENLPPGALSPAISGQKALVIPVYADTDHREIIAAKSTADELSLAQGELFLENDGSLRVRVGIQFGSWKGGQMRASLKQLPEAQLQNAFEEIAEKLFPGATNVSGQIKNRQDPGQRLEITIACEVPHFVNWESGQAEIRNLIAPLSLRTMYANSFSRVWPLMIDVPLLEKTTYVLHLPQEVSVTSALPAASLAGPFGSFKIESRWLSPNTIEVSRGFSIAAQTIPAQEYPDFSDFAARAEQAEREAISLSRAGTSAAILGFDSLH
jgi:tetratricopeptide (TPR) repeat protein